jgi:hypothetical protein
VWTPVLLSALLDTVPLYSELISVSTPKIVLPTMLMLQLMSVLFDLSHKRVVLQQTKCVIVASGSSFGLSHTISSRC